MPSILLAAYLGHAATATTAGYSAMAASYVAQVDGWERGQFRLRPGSAAATLIVPGMSPAIDNRAD